ncbi:MAG: HAD family hydrolase [Clostridia bacterium]|nr:HAD family hydrolase [Clostridia bacterium]
MYKNYIFDLYGTLADIHTDESDISLWQKTAEYYTKNGAAYTAKQLQDEYIKAVENEKKAVRKQHPEYKHIDIKIEKVFSLLYRNKGVACKDSDKLTLDTALYFRKWSRDYIKLYDGIAQLLDDLKKAGGNVYLLTNAQRAFTWDELQILGILDKFDGILISSDAECSKPDIHFYKAILSRFDLKAEESIMTGNDPTADIRGAKAAGLSALYIHTNISPAFDPECGADFIIPNGDTLKMRDYLL